MNYSLAIDQGTHASRALLYDEKGSLIAHQMQAIALHKKDEHIEQDPLEILASINTVVDHLLASLPCRIVSQIASCGIACQRSTIVACNHQGESLSAAISWQDVRGERYLETLPIEKERIQYLSGLPVSAHYAASKLRWLLDHHPRVKKALTQKDLYLSPLISFLLLHLVQPRQYVVDHSHAQRMQLWDIETADWSTELLDAYKIPRHVLPDCKPMCDNYGLLSYTNRAKTKIANRANIPVTAVCGDQNAALLGSGGLNPETALVNLGSGAFILRMMPTLQRSRRLLSGIAYSTYQEIRYLREATVNGSGNALSWFQQQQGMKTRASIERWKAQLPLFLKESQASSFSSSTVFINSVGGLGSPWWSTRIAPHFIAAYPSDKHAETRTENSIAKNSIAVIESILFLIQDNLNIMTKEQPLSSLIVSGGLSQLGGICQKLANLSQIPVTRLADKETTARGVAWLASSTKTPWLIASEHTFQPLDDPHLLQRYQRFQYQLAMLLKTE